MVELKSENVGIFLDKENAVPNADNGEFRRDAAEIAPGIAEIACAIFPKFESEPRFFTPKGSGIGALINPDIILRPDPFKVPAIAAAAPKLPDIGPSMVVDLPNIPLKPFAPPNPPNIDSIGLPPLNADSAKLATTTPETADDTIDCNFDGSVIPLSLAICVTLAVIDAVFATRFAIFATEPVGS